MWKDRFLREGNHRANVEVDDKTAMLEQQQSSAMPQEQTQDVSLHVDVPVAIGYITRVNGAGAVLRCPLERFITDESDDDMLPAGQIGAMVKVKVDKGYVFCTVCTVEMVGDASSDTADVILTVEFLGHGIRAPRHPAGMIFDRGISAFPMPGAKVYEVSVGDVEAIFGINDSNHMQIGTIYPHHLTPASVKIDSMLGKHFAVLGSTGTGKSCSVALLIHRIAERLPNGHILILDPHNEYAEAFSDCGEHFDITNLQLPYWLMNFEEHVEMFIGSRMTAEREVEVDILRRAIHNARVANAEGVS